MTDKMHFFLELICIFFYYVLLLLIIKKWSFFKNTGISFNTLCLLFSVKFLFGLGIYYVYTFYYTDRKTADIFKYFDDAQFLFENVFVIFCKENKICIKRIKLKIIPKK